MTSRFRWLDQVDPSLRVLVVDVQDMVGKRYYCMELSRASRKAGASLLEGRRLLSPELEQYRYDVIKE